MDMVLVSLVVQENKLLISLILMELCMKIIMLMALLLAEN